MPNKVLIVDADLQVWQTVVAWLVNLDYEICYSRVYSDALEKVRTQPYDMIIVDLQWANLGGVSYLSSLSQIQPEATLIAVSEFVDRELEQEVLQNGANFCFTKPLIEEDLMQAINFVQPPNGNGAQDNELISKNIEQLLLRGFNPDQQWEFRMLGSIRNYHQGENIPLNDETGTMFWVERGKLSIFHNMIQVENLVEGDYWGEETFVVPSPVFTMLVAQEAVQLRHFRRKLVLEFFAYHDETLTKVFMINIIKCMLAKWKSTITRLTMSAPDLSTLEM